MVTVDGNTGVVTEGAEQKDEEVKAAPAAMAPQRSGHRHQGHTSMWACRTRPRNTPSCRCPGVGLMRIEFLFTSYIQEHPCSLIEQGRQNELIDKLAEGIAIVGKAFYPRPIILRTSRLQDQRVPGHEGRGQVRAEGAEPHDRLARLLPLRLRLATARRSSWSSGPSRRSRDEMGLKNVMVMLPFVRTIDEVKKINRDDERGGTGAQPRLQALPHGRDPVQHLHGRGVLRLVRRFQHRQQRPHPAHHGRGPRLGRPGADGLLRRAQRGHQARHQDTSSMPPTRRVARWASAARHHPSTRSSASSW